jgi:hypothetical protein
MPPGLWGPQRIRRILGMDALSGAAGEPVPVPAPRVAPPAVRGACALALAGFGIWFLVESAKGIRGGMPDFEYFYKAGASLLERGSLDAGIDRLAGGAIERRGTIDWYLPFTSRLMTLISWLPYRVAGGIWILLNLAAMFTVLRLLAQHTMGLPREDWPVVQFLPFLFLIAYWVTEFRLNQINALTLLLIVASFVLWQAGRTGVAGLWLGMAVLIKLAPALLLLWFGLKRQYRTLTAALATIVLAGPLADLLIFGPRDTFDLYAGWLHNAVDAGSHTGLIERQRETDWRNQGLGIVLSRWLHPTNYATHFDNEPRASVFTDPPAFINRVELPRGQVTFVVHVIAGLTVLGLVVLARRPAAALSAWQLRFEWALFVLAMLWLMPVMRRYHMVWCTPAMSLLAAGIAYAGRTRWSFVALGCIAASIACQVALLAEVAQAAGVSLLAILLLAAPLVLMLVVLQRNPRAIPQDACLAAMTPRAARPQKRAAPGTSLAAHA